MVGQYSSSHSRGRFRSRLQWAGSCRPSKSDASKSCTVLAKGRTTGEWPAIGRAGNFWQNMQWLDEFIGNCTGCRFDYVAAHVYKCNVGDTMDYLQTLHNTYNKPVWLTEFACAGTFDVNVQLSYMQRVLPKLEAAPHVFRYVWDWTPFEKV